MQVAFWIVLIVAVALTLTRVSSITHRMNAAIAVSGTSLAIAFALMLPPVYHAVDGIFIRTNFTDLLAKLAIFVATNVLCDQVARVLNDHRALVLVSGLRGRVVFAVALAAALISFAFTDTPTASPGLELYLHEPAAFIYNLIAVAYLAYLAAVLLPGLTRDLNTTRNRRRRTASGLLAAGFGIAVLRAFLMLLALLPGWYEVGQIVSALSALCVIAGLAAAWAALRVQGSAPLRTSLLRTDEP